MNPLPYIFNNKEWFENLLSSMDFKKYSGNSIPALKCWSRNKEGLYRPSASYAAWFIGYCKESEQRNSYLRLVFQAKVSSVLKSLYMEGAKDVTGTIVEDECLSPSSYAFVNSVQQFASRRVNLSVASAVGFVRICFYQFVIDIWKT